MAQEKIISFSKKYPHNCYKCGKKMKEISDSKMQEITELSCPKCGTMNSANSSMILRD